MASILLPWVAELGLRHQGVLMSAARGCDVAVRHDPSKLAQRILRAAMFVPHAGRFANPKSYIRIEPDAGKWWETMNAFSGSWDHYPNHYIMHFVHATEIIGYYADKSSPTFSHRFFKWYVQACTILHLNPETKEQLEYRLDADEALFNKLQADYHREEIT